jgi:hypothetical protein
MKTPFPLLICMKNILSIRLILQGLFLLSSFVFSSMVPSQFMFFYFFPSVSCSSVSPTLSSLPPCLSPFITLLTFAYLLVFSPILSITCVSFRLSVAIFLSLLYWKLCISLLFCFFMSTFLFVLPLSLSLWLFSVSCFVSPVNNFLAL